MDSHQNSNVLPSKTTPHHNIVATMFNRFLHMMLFDALMRPMSKILFSIRLVSVEFRFITAFFHYLTFFMQNI